MAEPLEGRRCKPCAPRITVSVRACTAPARQSDRDKDAAVAGNSLVVQCSLNWSRYLPCHGAQGVGQLRKVA